MPCMPAVAEADVLLTTERPAPAALGRAAGPFRVTLFTSARGLLTKRLHLDTEGRLRKEPAANMSDGTAEVLALADLHEFDALLQRVTPAQAIGQGIAREPRARIVNERREQFTGNAIARTQRHFQFPAGPGFMLLDHDGMPGERLTADGFRQRLVSAVPELAAAPLLVRQSVSAGVRGPDGALLTPFVKWHAYLPVSDASLIPAAGDALALRLWAAGVGWCEVSASGAALPRTLFDLAVLRPERLDFCAAPALGEGLSQEWLPSRIYGDPAAAFDLSRITAVDSATAARAAANQQAAREAVAQQCREQRAAWEAQRAAEKAAAAPAKAKGRPRATAAPAGPATAPRAPRATASTEALANAQADEWAAELLFNRDCNLPRLPLSPYCADELRHGLRIARLARALGRAHIQVNPPGVRMWMVFDVDRAGANDAWQGAGLPPPTWTATNPENGHAHLAWGLSFPVTLGCEDSQVRRMAYLAAVEGSYAARLGADPSYHGLTTKNPLHPRWTVSHGERLDLYTLGELADCLPELPAYRPPCKGSRQAGVGRAVSLFTDLRKWAVKAIRAHWDAPGGFESWAAHCSAMAAAINGAFQPPLEPREEKHAAKCVARWTWKRTTREGFSEWQSAQGKKSGAARRAASEPKRARALEMSAAGQSQRAIAAELGVNQSTVARWLKQGDA